MDQACSKSVYSKYLGVRLEVNSSDCGRHLRCEGHVEQFGQPEIEGVGLIPWTHHKNL